MMFKHWKGTFALLVGAVGVGLLWAGLAFAKKPPPPPPPEGTIYFRLGGEYVGEVWGMDGDGSGKFVDHSVPRALGYEADQGEPSSLDYEGERWWLTIRNDNQKYELWAYRSPVADPDNWVQLTDVSAQGIDLYGGVARWSNDGSDSFVSFSAYDGTGPDFKIYRLQVSGAAINTHANGGTQIEPAASEQDPRLELKVTGGIGFAWSPPEQNKIVYTGYTGTGEYTGVWIKDLSPGGDEILVHDGGGHDWAPDGTKIAFRDGTDIWTMNADGSDAQVVAQMNNPRSEYDYYSAPFWSPDSTQLTFRELRMKKKKGQGGWAVAVWIHRIPAEGGELVTLTEDLDEFGGKLPLGWRD